MESWQSGNAPDSKSGEPSFSLARRFKSCTLLKYMDLMFAKSALLTSNIRIKYPKKFQVKKCNLKVSHFIITRDPMNGLDISLESCILICLIY